MSTTTRGTPGGTAVLDDRVRLGTGPIVVAADGNETSRTALDATFALASRSAAGVRVVTVQEPLMPVAADSILFVEPPEATAARKDALVKRVQQQVADACGAECAWTIELYDGDPPNVVARVASEAHARVVVVGLGKHDIVDRFLGEDTALRLLRRARVPVLAVPLGYHHLPKRILIGTDFSAASLHAAHVALALFDSITHIVLAHVQPRHEALPALAALSVEEPDADTALEQVRAELNAPEPVVIETVRLQGKAARELLRYAHTADIDLIVTGRRGAGRIERVLVGSTAAGVLKAASCAVLVVPSGTSANDVPLEAPNERIREDRWARDLEVFTQRNAGRRTSLEVDDPEFGAQAQEYDYPLLGVAYDHHDRRVEIMLGDFEGVGRHLTRGIAHVEDIDVLRHTPDRDWILRLSHGDGQTILTLLE